MAQEASAEQSSPRLSKAFFSNPAELAFSAMDLKIFLNLVSEYRALTREARQIIEILMGQNTELKKELTERHKKQRRAAIRKSGSNQGIRL